MSNVTKIRDMRRIGFTQDGLLNGHVPLRNGYVATLGEAEAAEVLARVDGTLDLTPRHTADAYGLAEPCQPATPLRQIPCTGCGGRSRMTPCPVCGGTLVLLTI